MSPDNSGGTRTPESFGDDRFGRTGTPENPLTTSPGGGGGGQVTHMVWSGY